MKLEFSRQIFLKTQISGFVKIHPVGGKLFRVEREGAREKLTDTRTDMTKLIVARKFEV
jgi:hypothetical protein